MTNRFCFFTNYESQKAQELLGGLKAALVFHWQKPFHRQIRVRGLVEKMSYEESDAYFQSRHRGSQIGAWASPQSQEINGRQELTAKTKELEEKFNGQTIPCPPFWGGFRIKPLSIEFWEAQDHRLHNRIRFEKKSLGEPWAASFLAP